MAGIKHNLKQTLEIADSTADPRIKLQARAIANDCYKYIMDLATNGVVVNNAIGYISQRLASDTCNQIIIKRLHLRKNEKGVRIPILIQPRQPMESSD